MKDASFFPSQYSRYIQAATQFLRECVKVPADLKAIQAGSEKMRMQKDVLLALGAKPNERVLRQLREGIATLDTINKVCEGLQPSELETNEQFLAAWEHMKHVTHELRLLGITVGFTIKTTASEPVSQQYDFLFFVENKHA